MLANLFDGTFTFDSECKSLLFPQFFHSDDLAFRMQSKVATRPGSVHLYGKANLGAQGKLTRGL